MITKMRDEMDVRGDEEEKKRKMKEKKERRKKRREKNEKRKEWADQTWRQRFGRKRNEDGRGKMERDQEEEREMTK